MHRLTIIVVIAIALAGCSRREPLPASHADPEASEGAEVVDPALSDPVRMEVRRIHADCDVTVDALREGVADADRREAILTAIAALAYVVGQIADSDQDAEGALYGPGGTQSYRCEVGADGVTHEGPGCNFQQLPSRAAGEGGPIDQQTDEVHLSAGDQIRQINRGVDALDDFLFSNPDTDAWGEAEREQFRELSEALSVACHE